jgi:drug/metabolite transporter (DMT)-like permease
VLATLPDVWRDLARTSRKAVAELIPVAIALALVAAALHGTWNVLVKVSGEPMVTLQRATTFGALAATPLVAVGWWFDGRPGFTPAAAGLAALSAALELAYCWLLSTAYQRGELSVVYPIARGSAPLLAVLVGLGVLGERLALAQLAGVTLLLVGILAVTLPQTSGRATMPALLTGVAIAAYTAVDRVGVRLSTPWLYGWLLVSLLAIGLSASIWLRSKLRKRVPPSGAEATQPGSSPSRPITWRRAAVIGAFMWTGYFLVLVALSIAPLSVVAPVRETAVVGVAVWGIWKLTERRAAGMKLLGASATLAGVALLAL